MKIKDITNYLESYAPTYLQEPYDNSGLIVGDLNSTVKGALITLDCTEDIIEEALEMNCQLIIAHHPIIFKPLKKINGKNYIEKVIIKAIRNNIAIYAIHTNLDNILNGVNSIIAKKIGLINTRVLKPKKDFIKKISFFCPKSHSSNLKQKLWNIGAGNLGHYSHCSFSSIGNATFMPLANSSPTVGEINKLSTLDEEKIEMVFPSFLQSKILLTLFTEHPYEEVAHELYDIESINKNYGSGVYGVLDKPMKAYDFLEKLKNNMQTDCIKYTKLIKEEIKSVAICGGSGQFLLEDAKKNNADIFISSDFKYHQFFDAENDIIIADIGHYESEQFTKDLIYNLLEKKFTTFAFQLSKINTNPIKYL